MCYVSSSILNGIYGHICLDEKSLISKLQHFITCGNGNGQNNNPASFGFVHKNCRRSWSTKLNTFRSGLKVYIPKTLVKF